MTHELLHGDERCVFADAGYTGVDKRPENEGNDLDWYVASGRGQVK
jgi:IS5 family transposase